MKRFFWFYLPPLVWMGIIFYLSSDARPSIITNPILNFFIYKTVHMVEFGTLFFLLFRAIYKGNKTKINFALKMALWLTFFYAISDEYHQSFIPTRNGNPIDVIIDTIGATFVYSFIRRKISLIKIFL